MPLSADAGQQTPSGYNSPRGLEILMATHEHEPGEMLTAAELARELKVSRRTLARWRSEGTGPPFFRVGRSPRYRWGDVQAWIERTRWPADG
jgi:excisionase family DNA binding protein